ncbi:hypothetical protein H8I91_09280 [Serratia fonticola]|uniref:hypothetical protein n=1 Tax=Serratia fonticola TaxID=47917 RepID=UPI001645B72E|nr:hypothetical protein [Serratia fonticola]MBC3250453.1 hypothetical protein [Serratia fonticola]
MSATANWSYTAKATIWPLTGTDDWNKPAYGLPVVIYCDYGSKTRRKGAEAGREISVKLYVWTEYADAKMGDKLAIGEFYSPTPVDDADMIIDIGRDADTFDRIVDDYEIATG